ncbi:MAG: family 10 glycosylhydrolase, partial [Verrucomicrobia bacterium]|nr:family 10 glycosylhydrolase [Verrucomicrobiota bacterium]
VSPFGIYTKGAPADVAVQLDQYNDLYADPVTWLKQGWVDYLSPQLYWRDKSAQSFSSLLQWWRSPTVNPRQIAIYPSINLDHLGGSSGWPVDEIAAQLAIELTTKPRFSGGFILWNIGPVLRNQKGVSGVVARTPKR